MDKSLDTKEVARLLKVSKETVYRYCREGLLPHYKIKSALRFREEDLEEWLKRGARNVLTIQAPLDIEEAGGNELAKKKPTCLNYGRVYLRTYKSGRSSWTIDYRDENGKRVQKALPTAQSREEALFILQRKVREVFDRKHGVERRRRKIGFSHFAEIYLQDYAMITKKSWETDAYRMKMLNEFFKDKELREITPLMVERFRKSRLKAGNTKSTCNRYLQLLKKMFNVAGEEGYAEENPIQKVKLFSEKDVLRERILTEEEEERLLKESADHLRPILILALNTGMRRGEILNLKWSQVDFTERKIVVEKTKSQKFRFLPMNSTVYNELRRLKAKNAQNPFVLLNPETGKPYVDVMTAFKAACRRAGVEGLRFHDLRYTFASRLVKRGADIVTVQTLLGHSTVTLTQRYTHADDERKREAVELLSRGEEGKICDVAVTQKNQSNLIN